MKVTINKQHSKIYSQLKKSQNKQDLYQKNVIQINPFRKVKDTFFQFSTNISYFAKSKITGFSRSFNQSNNKLIYIFGEKYVHQNQAKKKIQSLIWFSYRKIPGLTKQYNSDNGWGCLIRVGQMALAAGLTKFLQEKCFKNKKQQIRYQIIHAFLQSDGENQKYSLRKIVNQGTKLFGLKYGNWFNSNQICQILTSLHTCNPMKGASQLVLINFEGNCISTKDMLQKMNVNTICKCNKRRILCQECKSNLKSSSSYKKLIVFANCRLAQKQVSNESFDQLTKLLSLKCSIGIIGGIPRKGLYFIGYQKAELICLDPHIVQEQVTSKNQQQMMKTFSCRDILLHKRGQIDPSLAFVFYIDSLETMSQLQNQIYNLQTNPNVSQILSIQWNTMLGKNGNSYEVDQRVLKRNLRNSFVETL